MKAFFLALSATWSVIPGIAALWKGISTPPGYEALFGPFVEILAVLTLAVLWINRRRIGRMAKKRQTRTIGVLGVTSIVLLLLHFTAFEKCVVEHEGDVAYFPLWLSGSLQQSVEEKGSRYDAIDAYGIGAVRKKIRSMASQDPFALPTTTLLLLILHGSVVAVVTAAFAIAGLSET